MEVDSQVFYWTEVGMRARGYGEGYITVREAERLLEEADERRRTEGGENTIRVISPE